MPSADSCLRAALVVTLVVTSVVGSVLEALDIRYVVRLAFAMHAGFDSCVWRSSFCCQVFCIFLTIIWNDDCIGFDGGGVVALTEGVVVATSVANVVHLHGTQAQGLPDQSHIHAGSLVMVNR